MSNVFFVHNSPIQVLNAYEAKMKYCPNEKSILVIFIKNKTLSFKQVLGVLDESQWDEIVMIPMSSLSESTARYFQLKDLARRLSVDRVFTSMLGSHPIHHFINCVKKQGKNCQVIFFDEGTHSIFALRELEGTNYFKEEFQYNRFKLFFKKYILGLKLDPIIINEVFSLYSNDMKLVPLKVNDFQWIKSQVKQKAVYNETWFLGQHLYLGEISRMQYLYYLEQVADFYKNETLIYIPHRYEQKDVLREIRKNSAFTVRELNDCVEYTLLNHDYYPKEISGFTSSALFNIEHIYKNNIKVRSFRIPQEEIGSKLSSRMEVIYNKYQEFFEIYPLNGFRRNLIL